MDSADPAKILIVEDELHARRALVEILSSDQFTIEDVGSGEEALRKVEIFMPDLVISDLKLPGISGIDLIPKVKKLIPEAIFIMMTAYGSIENAVEAMRRGAEHYLIKPLNIDELELVIERELKRRRLVLEAKHLREQVEQKYSVENIIGCSPEMQEVYKMVTHASPARSSVLILGESGTGKELVARALHQLSPRRHGPFITVNCAALSETLLESELFGHEKGSFTGATQRRQGRFELANGGTLFLDEIGEIPPPTQVKLLRFLQEHKFERVGGNQTLEVDVRVIAATNRDLETLVRQSMYRDDLYYRLNVISIKVPPLRQRKADIPLLIDHFLNEYAEIEGFKEMRIDKEVLPALFGYEWPGNVRELENVIERAVVMSRGAMITLEHLPTHLGGGRRRSPLEVTIPGSTLQEIERAAIMKTLDACGGSTHKAAEVLRISVRKIQYKLKEYREAGIVQSKRGSQHATA